MKIVSKLLLFIKTYLDTRKKLNKSNNINISDYQYKESKEIIQYAWNNIPFYRTLWQNNGFSPEKFNSLEDFYKIPIIDRNDIIANLEQMVPTDYDRSLLSLVTTGGTSGMPMKFYINNYIARAKEIAFTSKIYHDYFGMKIFDKVAIIRGYHVNKNKIDKNIFWQYSIKQRGLIFSSFHINSTNYELYLNKLRDYKPKFIKAYPSSIVALCTLIKQNGDHGIPGLKGIICSSENVYDWQRSLVMQTLGVKIYSFYGHSEKCVIAFQDQNNNMVFHPLYGYTEFIDKEGLITNKESTQAEIVVTGFNHDYFPLIRYRTNDYIIIGKKDQKYGQTANRILGREQDFVYDLNGDKVIFTCSDEPLWDIDGIVAYQYIQSKKGILQLCLQCNNQFSEISYNKLKINLEKYFINFKIEIKQVDNIPKTPRGKFKYLIQNIKSC